MQSVWNFVLRGLSGLGFCIRWTTIEANHVGLPMKRARWFCYAARANVDRIVPALADPLPVGVGLEQHLRARESECPPPHGWLSADGVAGGRLALCGLSVVPMQAFLAARLLSSTRYPADSLESV